MRKSHLFVALVILTLIPAVVSWAEIPGQISFQGKLTRQNGGPIADDNYQLNFKIYNDPVLFNTLLWEERDTLTTKAGLFQIILGAANPIPDSVFSDTNAYLAIEFVGNELQPRKPFRSVGFAYHAAIADSALMADSDWAIDGANIYHLNGNVGIGTTSPTERLQVAGIIHSLSSGFKFPDGTIQITSASPIGTILDYGASTNLGNVIPVGQLKICYGTFQPGGCIGTIINLPFSSASSYTVMAGRENLPGPVSQTVATWRDSGGQFIWRDVLCGGTMISWIAIGY
jgi:hypothetical protein